MRLPRLLTFFILTLLATAGRAPGQLIVIRNPHQPVARSFEVREMTVEARVRDQVAEVRVSQTFHNPGSTPIESEFLFPMPEDGAVSSLVLMADGQELPGRVLTKEEARRIYEEIVRSKRDPALLEYMGRGLFKTSVFPIPPGADRQVTLRYAQVLKRDGHAVEFAYPFSTQKFTAKPIQNLTLSLDVESREPIKSVYCPSHDPAIHRGDDRGEVHGLVPSDGGADHRFTARFVQRDVIPSSDFRLIYTLAEGDLGATVLSTRPSAGEDGYFLLLASPKLRRPDETPQPKSVVFVLDRSGSMSGKKIEQARKSLRFVLDNLRDGDLFNIIAYDDRVETYKPELQRYSGDARAEAVRYVENIQPGGSTNIDGALRAAMEMLRDEDRPSYVLFLTDGLPTAGETKETVIAAHAKEANKAHVRLFAFGVGYDVNARLLDRLSGGNSGTSEYVSPAEDIEAKVARFFAKLTSPVLAGMTIDIGGTDLNRTYPRDVPDLFEGGQLVWVGRYRSSGKATVRISGKVGGERQSFEFPVELAEAGRGSSYDFVERLWAVRRVGFLLDQIDLHGSNHELTDELVELSKRYGILTPYTSFLADERTNLHLSTALREQTDVQLRQFNTEAGAQGVGQRAAKGSYLSADRLSAVTAPAARMMGRGMAMGGGGLGMAGGYGTVPRTPGLASAKPAAGANGPAVTYYYEQGQGTLAKDLEGRDVMVDTVRTVGRKTFYRRDNRWVDAEVKPEDEAKAIAIEPFTDAYYRLAESGSSEENQYLSFTEPVTVALRGKVYRIEPARP